MYRMTEEHQKTDQFNLDAPHSKSTSLGPIPALTFRGTFQISEFGSIKINKFSIQIIIISQLVKKDAHKFHRLYTELVKCETTRIPLPVLAVDGHFPDHVYAGTISTGISWSLSRIESVKQFCMIQKNVYFSPLIIKNWKHNQSRGVYTKIFTPTLIHSGVKEFSNLIGLGYRYRNFDVNQIYS